MKKRNDIDVVVGYLRKLKENPEDEVLAFILQCCPEQDILDAHKKMNKE